MRIFLSLIVSLITLAALSISVFLTDIEFNRFSSSFFNFSFCTSISETTVLDVTI